MKKVVINNKEYELVKNEKDGYNELELINKMTDYFDIYDYVVGDWAYSKLRLKGFYDENNKEVKDYNNIKKLDKYIHDNCAYGCKYFVIKRVK